MIFNDIEPLEPGHWMRSIRRLAMRTLDDEVELERALRHAFHLVQLAPRPLRHVIHCTGSEAEFEALLEAQAFERAILCLLGNRTHYCLTKASDEQGVTAEVWYPDLYDRHSATERLAAWALFRAWLECTSAIGGGDEDGDGPERSARMITIMPGETSTEH